VSFEVYVIYCTYLCSYNVCSSRIVSNLKVFTDVLTIDLNGKILQ